MIRPVNNKKYTNAHPIFERITGEKVEPERIELASGISFRDLKNLPGNTTQQKLEKKLVDNFLQGKLSDADVETVCSHKGYFRLTESSDIDDRVLNNVNGLKMIKCLRKKDTKLAQRVIKKFESSSSNSAIKKAAYDVVDSFIRKDDSLKNFLQSNKK